MSNYFESTILSSCPNDAVFLVWQGKQLTYGRFFQCVNRFANAMVKLGVKPGDRVVSQVEKSPEALALYVATVKAGGIFVVLNTSYTPSEISYFIQDASPALVVVSEKRVQEIAAAFPAVCIKSLEADGTGNLLQLAENESDRFSAVPRGAADKAAILYTSGTTGKAKGAVMSHENLVSNTLTLKNVWRFDSADVLLHALPIYHTHGLFVACNLVLACGASMIFLPKFEADAVFQNMDQCTVMMGIPTFYTRLLNDPRLHEKSTASMRLFISGSAPLRKETHDLFREKTGHRILERYGMTETGMISSNPYEGERRAGSVGFPLPGTSLRIVDPETGKTQSAGSPGSIEVKGNHVFSEYWGMKDKTAESFREDGYFITGDVGVFSDDGYLSIVGREKDLIITGGLNVYPKEIENVIDSLSGVEESAVFGVPHPDFGEGVVAAVVCNSSHVGEAEILEALSPKLANFKQPKKVFRLDALPRNSMGKVQKNELRKQFAKLFTA